ncbi:MAG: type I 3-dehydroquinate dehydratase [Propionibacteriaceae bacterium]
MLFSSIMAHSLAQVLPLLVDIEAAELRLDHSNMSREDLQQIVANVDIPLLATCHSSNPAPMLSNAIEAGFSYVDLAFEDGLDSYLLGLAHTHGCRVVASYHNYEKTPSAVELTEIIDAMFTAGADIAKVACQVLTPRDAARLIGLLDDDRPIVSLGMGEAGRITRLTGVTLESPLSFIATSAGATASGQFNAATIRQLSSVLSPSHDATF